MKSFAISIGDLVEHIAQIVNKELSILVDQERLRPDKSEVQRLWADSKRARNILKWKPEVSLEQGLQKTVEWIEKNLERYSIGKYQV